MKDAANENDTANNKINDRKTISIKYFEYKTKITGKIPHNVKRLNTEVVVPLKY